MKTYWCLVFLKNPFQLNIIIVMGDADGSFFKEIDTFHLTLPFPPVIQDKAYTGIRGIANITLSTDFKCIEPDACNSPSVTSESTGTYKIRLRIHCTTYNSLQYCMFVSIMHTRVHSAQTYIDIHAYTQSLYTHCMCI